MTDTTVFQFIETVGSAPLMALVAFMLWKIEKRITILAVKIEFAAGLRSREEAEKVLNRLGEKESEF